MQIRRLNPGHSAALGRAGYTMPRDPIPNQSADNVIATLQRPKTPEISLDHTFSVCPLMSSRKDRILSGYRSTSKRRITFVHQRAPKRTCVSEPGAPATTSSRLSLDMNRHFTSPPPQVSPATLAPLSDASAALDLVPPPPPPLVHAGSNILEPTREPCDVVPEVTRPTSERISDDIICSTIVTMKVKPRFLCPYKDCTVQEHIDQKKTRVRGEK